MSKLKPVSWVFRQVAEKVPRSTWSQREATYSELIRLEQEDDDYDRAITSAIIGILQNTGEQALIRRQDRTEARLSPGELAYVPPSRLRWGVLDCMDYRLEGLRDWHGSEVFLPETIAEQAISRSLAALNSEAKAKGGRPEHPAKAWYAAQGFERRGRSMKELQRQMKVDTGVTPPSEATIRSWEKSAKIDGNHPQKPR